MATPCSQASLKTFLYRYKSPLKCGHLTNQDTLTGLHLIELHHVKAAGPTPMMTGPSLGAGTQSNSGLAAVGSVGNRGLLLGPHMTSIESFRGAPGMRVSGCGLET